MQSSSDRRRAAWDRRASSYDARTAWFERRVLRCAREWVGSRADGEVLEVAVGTGMNLSWYRSDVRLSGVDWSAAMLERAARRADSLGVAVDLQVANATALPAPDSTFDTVVATFVLCEVESVEAALAEMIRVVRPGGRLLLADHVASTSRAVRLLQRAAEWVSVPLFGEHLTRRPLDTLSAMDVEIIDVDRGRLGLIELVHARRPGPERDAGEPED